MNEASTQRPRRRRAGVSVAGALISIVIAAVGCASEPTPEISEAEYRQQLTAICLDEAAARAALTEPADSAGVGPFARDVAALLTTQADAARAITAPGALDGDHRAFVQNTADQATKWNTLASTPPDDTDAFGALQTEILQLTLGRDDLATEMGLDQCRRSAS